MRKQNTPKKGNLIVVDVKKHIQEFLDIQNITNLEDSDYVDESLACSNKNSTEQMELSNYQLFTRISSGKYLYLKEERSLDKF